MSTQDILSCTRNTKFYDLVDYIYHSSLRPQWETAVLSACTFISSLAGRFFETPLGDTINIYALLLAYSGAGKGEMEKAFEKIQIEVGIDFSKYYGSSIASDVALSNHVRRNPTSLFFMREFGKNFKKMSSTNAPSYLRGIVSEMLILYQSTRLHQHVNAANDGQEGVIRPALSLLADSQPDTFYNSLTDETFQSGFIQRFIILEAAERRPFINDNFQSMTSELKNHVENFLKYIMNRNDKNEMTNNDKVLVTQKIMVNESATKYLLDYQLTTDKRIRQMNDDSFIGIKSDILSRAHQNAVRMAAIVACFNDCNNPIITEQCAQFGISIVKHTVEMFMDKVEGGAIGTDAKARSLFLINALDKYLEWPPGKEQKLAESNYISHTQLVKICRNNPAFNLERREFNVSLNTEIRALEDCGNLTSIIKEEKTIDFLSFLRSIGRGKNGKYYRINYPDSVVNPISPDLSVSLAIDNMSDNSKMLDAMQTHGVIPAKNLEINLIGEIVRFSTSSKPNARNGWYIAFAGIYPTIIFGDWSISDKKYYFTVNKDKMTKEDIKNNEQQRKLASLKFTQQKEQKAQEVQEEINAKFPKIKKATLSHPYLVKKMIKNPESIEGIRENCDYLVIPLYNADGEMITAQKIGENGNKRFLPGSNIKGCFHKIGEGEGDAYICEGYATGATIFEATGKPVIVSFCSSNLEHVIKSIINSNLNYKLIIAADNDHKNKNNIGIKEASKCASLFDIPYVFPEFLDNENGSDFNDAAIMGKDILSCLNKY